MNSFRNIDWAGLLQSARELWAEPGSNLGASLLFIAAVGIVLIILVVIVIGAIYSLSGEDEEEEEGEEGEESSEGPGESEAKAPDEEEEPPSEESAERFPRWARALVWVLLIVVAIVVFDLRSGATSVCVSCHTTEPHARAESDLHRSVTCVRCHEDRRGVGAFSAAASRAMHVVAAEVRPSWSGGYGAVTAAACRSCHKTQTSGVWTVKKQQVRVSHAEPLTAGANCTDCHVLNEEGEIGELTRGMTPCLRCHDGKRAKDDCALCHLGDPSAAIRDKDRNMVFSAEILVPDHRCGGCHEDQSKCDACHGLRMPHSAEFKANMHARPAAFEKKKSCFEVCHGINECNKCHSFHPGQRVSGHAPNWVTEHGRVSTWTSPCACHAPDDEPNKPFCPLCHDR